MKLLFILILILIIIYLSNPNFNINKTINKDITETINISKYITSNLFETPGTVIQEVVNVVTNTINTFFYYIFNKHNNNEKTVSTSSEDKSNNTNNNNSNCINPVIYDFLHQDEIKENFFSGLADNQLDFSIDSAIDSVLNSNSILDVSFKKINPNKLYYGLECKYAKNDSFYDALKEEGFKSVDNKNTSILDACLIVPCSYETTEKEVQDLEDKDINNNIYKDGVRIYMLNGTDFLASKLSLWDYLVKRFGEPVASTMVPYTWDLTTNKGINQFKQDFDKNKLYITKNNNQRQEGIKIHNDLDSILNVSDKLIVQELLQNPYLINGRKINLRVYVLVIKDSKNNFKVLVYTDGFMYYTPELFEKNSTDFKKNITTGYIDRQVYVENPLTHQDFKEYLDLSNRNLTPIELYIKNSKSNIKLSEYIFSQIYHLLAYVFETYNDTLGSKTPGVSFQLYGVDVAIDDELRPQIMEVNKGPDLTAKDDRDKKLKIGLCKDILKSVGLIDTDSNNKFVNVLEQVNINGKLFGINDFSN